jgi:hypothetical protein
MKRKAKSAAREAGEHNGCVCFELTHPTASPYSFRQRARFGAGVDHRNHPGTCGLNFEVLERILPQSVPPQRWGSVNESGAEHIASSGRSVARLYK